MSVGADTVGFAQSPTHSGAMMKPMAKRFVLAALRRHGCRTLSEEGKHEKWGCPLSCQMHVNPASVEVNVRAYAGPGL
jgi:hypothetical protein